MEEQINKKNIIYLFLTLILIFLFFYKGVILSGDEYLEEYNNFRNSTAKQNFSSLRKGNLNSGSNSAPNSNPNSNLEKKLFQVLQNFEDMKLSFSSSLHTLKTNQNQIQQKIEKLINNYSSEEFRKNISDPNSSEKFRDDQNIFVTENLKEILQELKSSKYNDEINSIEIISEGLNSNVELLRNYLNAK